MAEPDRVCTNKLEWLSVRLLDALGLSSRFVAICGADTFGLKKPDPELLAPHARRGPAQPAERAVMVGDPANDIDMARRRGFPVAVDFGYTETPASELNADRVISAFATCRRPFSACSVTRSGGAGPEQHNRHFTLSTPHLGSFYGGSHTSRGCGRGALQGFGHARMAASWGNGGRLPPNWWGLTMSRVIAFVACGFTLAACSASMPSLDFLKSSPATETLRIESEPPGADAKTTQGQTCRTPCELTVQGGGDLSVTVALNGYQPQTVALRSDQAENGPSCRPTRSTSSCRRQRRRRPRRKRPLEKEEARHRGRDPARRGACAGARNRCVSAAARLRRNRPRRPIIPGRRDSLLRT